MLTIAINLIMRSRQKQSLLVKCKLTVNWQSCGFSYELSLLFARSTVVDLAIPDCGNNPYPSPVSIAERIIQRYAHVK